MSDIKKIKDEFLLKLKKNLDLNQVNQIKTDLFGKAGIISSQFKMLGKVAEEERKKFASDLKQLKDELQNLISEKNDDIETKEINQKLEKEKGIEILVACETGLRAWGFPSPDSDDDVRIIYVHKKDL